MNKKKILPITLILILLISVLSPLVLSGGIFPPPTTYDRDLERERERVYNSTKAWNISEHVRDGTMDESWNASFVNATVPGPWMINNTQYNLDEFPGYVFDYSIMWNNTSAAAGHTPFHYMITNYSIADRTQSIVFTRAQNWSNDIYTGVVFSAWNKSDDGLIDNVTCVLYGGNTKCFVLMYNESTGKLWDAYNGTLVETDQSLGLTNFYNDKWIHNTSFYDYSFSGFNNGTWIKTIFNSYWGQVQSKIWGNSSQGRDLIGLLAEPTGWVVNDHIDRLKNSDGTMYGLGIWNPNGDKAAVQFDIFDEWRLNYTKNSSIIWSVASGGRPHMNFPIVNSSDINASMIKFFWDAESGNITMNSVVDLWIELTNNMSLESRAYTVNAKGTPEEAIALKENQNDTVYYYACIITNFNELANYWFEDGNPFEGNPDDLLYLWVHDCPQGNEDIAGLTYLFINVDTDNDGTYDVHDRSFLVSDFLYGSWTGSIPDATTNMYNNTYTPRGIQNLHRYNKHLMHLVMIPLTEFPHHNNDSGNFLNVNDTFGLSVISSNEKYDNNVCVWQNWNETNNSVHKSELSATALPWYTGTIILDHAAQLSIDPEHVGRWGEGQIGWLAGEEFKGNFGINIVKSANATSISRGLNTSTFHIINYSINVSNTGAGTLTGIQINDTWFNCSCSDFNMTWVNNSFNNTNTGKMWKINTTTVWWNTDSCYWLINITNLEAGQYFNFTFPVLLLVCDNSTRTIFTNTATVTTDQSGITGSDTHDIRWGVCGSLRIQATTTVFDVVATANTIITILGIVIIIGAIMAIVGLMYSYRDMW